MWQKVSEHSAKKSDSDISEDVNIVKMVSMHPH